MEARPASSFEGQRIICDGHYGTIKFYGEVPPSFGPWYGIEWDEDGRGKHEGEHNGVKYFECSRPGCGSFVRERKVQFGVSDVDAFLKKYDELHVVEEREELQYFYHVGRHEKHGSKERLAKLQHVNLRCTNISRADEVRSLGNIARNIVELDLSKTLLSNWQEVIKIVRSLPRLLSLNISENQVEVVHSEDTTLKQCNVKTLVANKMNLNWQQVLTMAASFVGLEELHASYNNIQTLQNGDLNNAKNLRVLDVEGNPLESWNDILLLHSLPNLESLALSNTKFDAIFFPGINNQTVDIFSNLKSLFLSKTMISSWLSVNQIERLPALQVLILQCFPLIQTVSEYDARQEIIARVAKCSQLNKSNVTVKERQMAERAYLKKYAKDWIASGGNPANIQSTVNDDFATKHPRYLFLLNMLGVPDNIGQLPTTISSLKDNLVAVTITCVTDLEKPSVTKKLPRTMTISKLKGLLQRLFKIQAIMQRLSYVDQSGHEVQMDDDLRALSFYSVESGGIINICY